MELNKRLLNLLEECFNDARQEIFKEKGPTWSDFDDWIDSGVDFESLKSLSAQADSIGLSSDVGGNEVALCGLFDPDTATSSATKCKCGREKWEHPKPKQ